MVLQHFVFFFFIFFVFFVLSVFFVFFVFFVILLLLYYPRERRFRKKRVLRAPPDNRIDGTLDDHISASWRKKRGFWGRASGRPYRRTQRSRWRGFWGRVSRRPSSRRRKRRDSRKLAKGLKRRKVSSNGSLACPQIHGREVCRVGRATKEMSDGIGVCPTFRAEIAVGGSDAEFVVLQLGRT